VQPDSRRPVTRLALLACGLLVAILVRISIGPSGFGLGIEPEILSIRAERAGLAALVGAALGVAGVLLQALLRNPLASPDLMGLSAGATAAVMLSFLVGAWIGLGSIPAWGVAGPAIAGSFGALLVVYWLSQQRGLIEPVTMLLAGVVVAIIAGSLAMLIRHMLPAGMMSGVTSGWMLGEISEEFGWPAVWIMLALLLPAILWISAKGRLLDAATLSDDEARSLGVGLGGLRLLLFSGAGILTAATVVIAGPIGFVGLVAPHAARMLLGPRHATLGLGAALLGAMMLVLADTLASATPVRGGRLPTGVVTALTGGPVFLWLLRREMKSGRFGQG